METKDTKQRLDDLQELLQAGYLTENEFRVARINALRESGVDIVIHTRKPETKHAREEEEEEEPRGCGCLLAFLLALAIGIGVVFFVPDWPDRLGGAYVRTVREWFSARWSSVFAVFSDAPSGPIPDPVASNSVPLPAIVVIVSDDQVARPVSSSDASSFEPEFSSASAPEPALPSSGVSSPDPARPSVSPDAGPELSIASAPSVDSLDPLAGRVSLPSLDARIFALPDIEIANMGVSQNIMMEEPNDEPNITIVEIPSSVPFNPTAPTRPASRLRTTQTTAPQATSSSRRGVVSARSARIRSAPDTSNNDNVVGWGQTGDRFLVLEEGEGRDGSKWYHVRYEQGNKQGWISGTLVTLEE